MGSWKKRKILNLCFMLSILWQTYKATSQCSPLKKWVKTEGVQNTQSKIIRKRKLLIVYFQIRNGLDFHL